jgi:AcrR family transcriptional regulator
MDQIAVETGVSKRTIYEIFRDKDDLLHACIGQMASENKQELNVIISQSENVIQALYMIGQHGENKRSSINHLFFDDLDKHYPHLRNIFSDQNESGAKSISFTILENGINEGVFIKEMNVAIVETFIHEMMKICHRIDLFPGDSDIAEIVKNVIIPYFRGISKPKGIDLIEKYFRT